MIYKNSILGTYELGEREIKEILNDDNVQEKWKKIFIVRLFEQLSKKELSKKDISERANENLKVKTHLYDDYSLSTTTLTECTNLERKSGLRTLSVNTLIATAFALDVSIDYLLGIEKCENHINTDIHKATGLTDDAINILRSNTQLGKLISHFLVNSELKELIKTIKEQEIAYMIYRNVSLEFSESLFNIIEDAFKDYIQNTFPLDRSVDRYEKYLFNILSKRKITDNYIEKNLSDDFLQQFKLAITRYNLNKEIVYPFVKFIAEMTYEILESKYYKEFEMNKISQSFLKILESYLKI